MKIKLVSILLVIMSLTMISGVSAANNQITDKSTYLSFADHTTLILFLNVGDEFVFNHKIRYIESNGCLAVLDDYRIKAIKPGFGCVILNNYSLFHDSDYYNIVVKE